jgi:acyl dehydratase
MVEDTNPLFLDPDAGKDSQYGSVIAPPVMAGYFAGGGPWPQKTKTDALANVPTRGERKINMNIDWEYLIPVKIGDQLSSQRELIDIFEKPIKLDPKAVWLVTETRITNQNDDIVAIGRNTLLTHRTPEQVSADS